MYMNLYVIRLLSVAFSFFFFWVEVEILIDRMSMTHIFLIKFMYKNWQKSSRFLVESIRIQASQLPSSLKEANWWCDQITIQASQLPSSLEETKRKRERLHEKLLGQSMRIVIAEDKRRVYKRPINNRVKQT